MFARVRAGWAFASVLGTVSQGLVRPVWAQDSGQDPPATKPSSSASSPSQQLMACMLGRRHLRWLNCCIRC